MNDHDRYSNRDPHKKPERYDLIPVDALADIARVFGHGATKHGDSDFLKGFSWSSNYASMQRHLNAFWGGEEIDPDSGLPHLALAGARALIQADLEKRFPELDDRPSTLQRKANDNE